MARKEFLFQGRTVAELQGMSVEEFALLLPSKERRKVKRGFTTEEKSLLQKLSRRDKVQTHAREMIVLPSMVGKTVKVHNGKESVAVLIQPEMIGKKLGTYALTRKLTKHSSAGVTRTKEKGRK